MSFQFDVVFTEDLHHMKLKDYITLHALGLGPKK
jgi:hypothetical protein